MSTDFERDVVTQADVEAARENVERKRQTLNNRRDKVKQLSNEEQYTMPDWALDDLQAATIALHEARAHLRYCERWFGVK